MRVSIDAAITKYKNNAEYERTHGNLQGCLEFRQLAKWLEQLQQIQEIVNSKTTRLTYEEGFRQIKEVVEDGKDND